MKRTPTESTLIVFMAMAYAGFHPGTGLLYWALRYLAWLIVINAAVSLHKWGVERGHQWLNSMKMRKRA